MSKIGHDARGRRPPKKAPYICTIQVTIAINIQSAAAQLQASKRDKCSALQHMYQWQYKLSKLALRARAASLAER